jgi:uncharacterized membrane protein
MTLKKYTISVTEAQYWDDIHKVLVEDSNEDGIPDRQVTCSDYKEHSPTRGTFLLHGNEAEVIKNHPHVEWIELDPTEYKDQYPKPGHYIKRFNKNVKVYRDLTTYSPPTTSPTSVELDRTGWQTIRTGIKTAGDFWGAQWGTSGDAPPINSDVSYSLTGRNVDVVVHDSGVLASHPEFLDENGVSRVRDVVLDGPYYIDPDYFDTNNLTYTRWDGRVGIATTAARNWWISGSNRSAGFSTIGTVSVDTGYTASRAIGVGSDGSNDMTSGHGTACASLVAGKTLGLGFEANIWNMSGIGEPNAMNISIEQNYDLMKLFHLYKPVNPETGVKNPTLVNGSWGYQAAFSSSSTVTYLFRGTTGTFVGNAAVTDQVTAMKTGLNNQVQFAQESWSSSSRSNSTDTAAREMMDTGVIYVAAAGNNNQRLGVGSSDPDRLNYMSDNYFGTTDPRSHFPSNCVPCNHRDWMNPQGIGFNSTTDPEWHPVICVGAMNDEFYDTQLREAKASYSNNGPGIDVWAPADETLAAGTNGVAGYTDYQRYDDSRFYDNYFNGTSAAAPVASSVLSLYLQTNPTATSRDVKNWINRHGSVVVADEQFQDSQPDDTQTNYWTFSFTLRGAERRVIYNPYSNDTIPKIEGLNLSGGLNIKMQ